MAKAPGPPDTYFYADLAVHLINAKPQQILLVEPDSRGIRLTNVRAFFPTEVMKAANDA